MVPTLHLQALGLEPDSQAKTSSTLARTSDRKTGIRQCLGRFGPVSTLEGVIRVPEPRLADYELDAQVPAVVRGCWLTLPTQVRLTIRSACRTL